MSYAKNNRLALSYTPGTGGDMIRSCLYLLIHSDKCEYKDNSIYLNDEVISFIDKNGWVLTPPWWKDDREFQLTSEIEAIWKCHHFESSAEVEHTFNLCDNPTFICIKDNKYLDVCRNNYIIKTRDGESTSPEIDRFDQYIKFRKENPHNANQIFYNLEKKHHIMYMDNFYDWNSLKQELKGFIKYYNITPNENFHIVKQFWNQWIKNQPNKKDK